MEKILYKQQIFLSFVFFSFFCQKPREQTRSLIPNRLGSFLLGMGSPDWLSVTPSNFMMADRWGAEKEVSAP